MDRFAQMALSAARMAEADSGIDIAAAPDRVGAAVATGIGGLGAFEDCFQGLLERGPDRTSPFSIIQIIPNMAAAWVSMELGTRGPLATETTACAASNMAIGDGLDAIRLGRADVMLCGGTEAPVTRVGIAGFSAMRALSQRNDDPKAGSRPFDADRDGFVMGEAGAMVVLEELERARARGAKIYAELLGYGVSSDARHVTEPDPTGENPARAMQMAFSDAGISPEQVGYVNAHGTSTPVGDPAETRVLKLALGEEHAFRTPVSSTKGATGHCLGAAGAVEAIFTIFAIQRGLLPPTINYETPDPLCDLDYIPNEARHQPTRDRSLQLVRLRRPQRVRRLSSLGRSRPRRGSLHELRAPFDEHGVTPAAVELPDPLAVSDDAEPEALVQRDARLVLREDARLDRPDPASFGARDQRFEEHATDSLPAGAFRDVDGVLDDSCVALAS